MAGLSKMTASLLSAANENTLALANLKFDFSLVKVEAPTEFSGLGKALSKRRRTDAEDGPHHKTARKLAALFEQLVPSTPQLIKAYGTRSSEISKIRSINPTGTANDGPFATYVGVDGTAMWAAATSGVPALGVYLLACLLARAWSAKEAISIWFELVDARRKEIQHGLENHHAVSESSQCSLFQDIQRSELALWDSSARAWLQSADQAKVKEQTQLMLIFKNVHLPFDGGSSTYTKVIDAWRHAMSGLEDLLCGRPQEIRSRSILLAFSAWHLYPDLIVLGSEVRNVPFGDHCVNPTGIGTIAWEPRPDAPNQATSWSLALSHLRYYGDPITVKSQPDFSRVDIDQLHIVALGSLLGHWNISQRDMSAAAQWFIDLWTILSINNASDRATQTEGLLWLQFLVQAASKVISVNNTERQEALQLLGYGQRRAKCFLGVSDRCLVPFFGLGYARLGVCLSQEDDEKRGLTFLREIAEENKLRPCDALITYDPKPIESHPEVLVREYVTAVPHSCASRKRGVQGDQLYEDVNVKWRYVLPTVLQSAPIARTIRSWERMPEQGERRYAVQSAPSEAGEAGFRELVWVDAPEFFDETKISQLLPCGKANVETFCCGRPPQNAMPKNSTSTGGSGPQRSKLSHKFRMSVRIGQLSLYVRTSVEFSPISSIRTSGDFSEYLRKVSTSPDILAVYLQYLVHPGMGETADTDTEVPFNGRTDMQIDGTIANDPTVFHGANSNSVQYWAKLRDLDMLNPTSLATRGAPDYVKEIAKYFETSRQCAGALRALTLATQVYRQLDGASISLKVVSSPLDESPWFDSELKKTRYRLEKVAGRSAPIMIPYRVPRANAFSCIAHFDSGSLHLLPEDFNDTLAIASGNSIYVMGELVTDPFDSIDGADMKRIVGNIGRPGLSILIAPMYPRIRSMAEEYTLVNHFLYDGRRENNFRGTSLHLSFTDWSMPLETRGVLTRTIDQDAYLIESVISVKDSGRWVADLDILCIDFAELKILESEGSCPGHNDKRSDHDYTSIDNWEELLDGPNTVGIFRAHGNWAARLAAVSILCQKDQAHSIGMLSPTKFCLDCLSEDFFNQDDWRKHESPLPSICID